MTPPPTPSVDALRERVRAAGLEVELVGEPAFEGFWAYAASTRAAALPAQGFKLHLSATVVNVLELFDLVVPLLLRRSIPFKCASSMQKLSEMNAGQHGLTQVGKFMTIYPASESDAVALARELDAATATFLAPEIPSDFPLRDGSLVHYRYGVIGGRPSRDAPGTHDSSSLELPDGSFVVDARDPRVPVPPWVDDPFVGAASSHGGAAVPAPGGTTADAGVAPSTLFADRFVIHGVLRQRGKGGVYRALEVDRDLLRDVQAGAAPAPAADEPRQLTRPVILKEARRAGEMEPTGTDAVARLHWQATLLGELADDPRFPRVHDTFELAGHTYLVMEEVQGPSLSTWLTTNDPTRGQMLAWSRQLAELVGTLHARGVAWCDLSPDNVILTGEQQTLSAADLEHAVRADGPPFAGVGTPGFFPHASQPLVDPSPFARDIYALGAMLHALWVPGWYRQQSFSSDPSHDRMWVRPPAAHADCPPTLRRIIRRASGIEVAPGRGSVATANAAPAPYGSIAEFRADLARARVRRAG